MSQTKPFSTPHLQHTLARAVSVRGVGLHTGRTVCATLSPAPIGAGISFVRTDLPGQPEIPALAEWVVDTRLATTLGRTVCGPSGAMLDARVSTVEHLLAALYAMGVDNARVLVDGPEVPAVDGSSGPYVYLIRDAGLLAQPAPRRLLRVRRPVSVTAADRRCSAAPARRLEIACEIDFQHPLIGRQRYDFVYSASGFATEIARARTFGFLGDVEAMHKAGAGLGGSLDNCLIVGPLSVLNPDGVRYPDEFVRHKVLDTLGDLALLGGRLVGRVESVCAGHALNRELVRALRTTPGALEVEELRPVDVAPEALGPIAVPMPA